MSRRTFLFLGAAAGVGALLPMANGSVIAFGGINDGTYAGLVGRGFIVPVHIMRNFAMSPDQALGRWPDVGQRRYVDVHLTEAEKNTPGGFVAAVKTQLKAEHGLDWYQDPDLTSLSAGGLRDGFMSVKVPMRNP